MICRDIEVHWDITNYYNVKNNFYEIFCPCQIQIGPKIKNTQSNIKSMPNSILMSKISFIKHLPPARPKLVPKLKMIRSY